MRAGWKHFGWTIAALIAVMQTPAIGAPVELGDLQRDAAAGKADAQLELGERYIDGRGVPRSPVLGASWVKKAAVQKQAAAAFRLGMLYSLGNGVPQNDKEAMKWFSASAGAGNLDAECSLGGAYRDGDGCKKDMGQAVKWYRLAAERGEGVKQSHGDAMRYLKVLAEGGQAEAMVSLGRMYEDGRGAGVDLVQAYAWYAIAAHRNDVDAGGGLRPGVQLGLEKGEDPHKSMDKLGKRLSPPQKALALQRAADWNALHH
jgi:TPR repeat protein